MANPNFTFPTLILMLAALTAGLTGCASYRGMPTHGGGKRFDEEQRVVAAAIRHTVRQMDLEALQGKRVALEFANLETSGTGQARYPGLDRIGFNGGYLDIDSITRRGEVPGTTSNQVFTSDDGSSRWDVGANVNFSFNPSLRSNNNITREDINYLMKVVEMRLRHDGLQIVGRAQAEAILIVLVDVFGTNHSRVDYGLAYRDELGASCELTYYAISSKNQVLLSPSQTQGAMGVYEETRARLTPLSSKARGVRILGSSLGAQMPVTRVGGDAAAVAGTGEGREPSAKSQMDALYQRAQIQLDANDREAAAESIRAIRAIDPDYSLLPELEQRLAEF